MHLPAHGSVVTGLVLLLFAAACGSPAGIQEGSDIPPGAGVLTSATPGENLPRVVTPTPTPTFAPRPPEVSIGILISDYVANSIAADQTYRGKEIFLKFPVMNIRRDISGDPFLLYSTHELAQFGIFGIMASFNRRDESDVAKLRLGDTVSLICMGDGLLVYILLADCIVAD